MATPARPARRNPTTFVTIGIACTAVWFAIAALLRAEEGLVADITWLASTLVAVVGVVAFVVAGALALRGRR